MARKSTATAKSNAVQRKEEPIKPIIIKDLNGNKLADFNVQLVQTIKDTVARGATDSELYMFLQNCAMYGLNPLMKQAWFMKIDGVPTAMTSRDGYLKIAKEDPNYKKVQSMAVYQNDTFSTLMVDGEVVKVTHEFSHVDRGHIVGAYAFLKTKDGEEDIFAYKDFKEYNKKNRIWSGYQESMIRKVAEADVLKRFANISGLVTAEEMGTEDLSGNYEYTEASVSDVKTDDVDDSEDHQEDDDNNDIIVEEVEK